MTPSPPEALAQHLSAELQRWSEIVPSAGIGSNEKARERAPALSRRDRTHLLE
jgi:hypothetical protein